MLEQGHTRALVALSRELHSVYALRLACQLSHLGRLDLELLHVIEGDPLPRGAGWAPHSWAREREEELRAELLQMVQAVGDLCRGSGELRFAHGRAREELTRRLEAGDLDMVILGGGGAAQPGGLLRHLARTSPVPLLVARGYRPLRRLLICADGSAGAERTLTFVGRLVGRSTLEATLLSVAGREEAAATERSLALLRAEGVEPNLTLAPGRGCEEVLAEAAQGDYDLLVLARTEPAGGLREVFLGGDPLLHIALQAPCPVLLQPRRT